MVTPPENLAAPSTTIKPFTGTFMFMLVKKALPVAVIPVENVNSAVPSDGSENAPVGMSGMNSLALGED